MKKCVFIAALTAALAIQSVAYAGYNTKTLVTVSATEAYGAVKAARSSSDSVEEIYCGVETFGPNASETVVECYAQDKSRNSLFCYLDYPSQSVVAAVAGINQTSTVDFAISDTSSQCQTVDVFNESNNL